MNGFPLSEFLVILGFGLFGAVAIIPYSFSMNREKMATAKLPPLTIALISFVQTAILVGITTAVGLLAARPTGLGAPFIKATLAGQPAPDSFLKLLPISIGLGILAFLAIILLDRFVFLRRIPQSLRQVDANMPAWKRFLASFYGGVNEEILLRLFLVSGLVWLIGLVWQNTSGLPATGAYWVAIVAAAILFGLGHLPATKAITPLTTLIVIRAIVLNGIGGIIFGWLYWQYGLEFAMIAHFSADIFLHLLTPIFAGGMLKSLQQSPGTTETK
jgi:hypothetical protein